jgi:glutathione peroxidase
MLRTFHRAVLATAALLALDPALAGGPAPAAPACTGVHAHTFPRLQDEKPQSLCQYTGKVLLVVNTASYCGYTPQYKGLEALHDKYKGRGLVVLGFPSNDFEQEKASNKEIADFCESTFGVKFPMFGASSVKGPKANALYKQLVQATGQEPRWNFYKYLVARDGSVVAVYPSKVTPQDAQLVADIERQLAAR